MISPSKRTLKNLEGVHPNLLKVIMRAYQITDQDFGVVAKAVRTQDEQDALFRQGRYGNPGPIVTWTTKSKHIIQNDGWGHAVDLTAFVGRDISWDFEHYPPIVKACKIAASELGVKIECGLDWTKPDPGHIQLAED